MDQINFVSLILVKIRTLLLFSMIFFSDHFKGPFIQIVQGN